MGREATPEGKSEADAWLYYNTYGVWPSWYAGYGGYGLALYGRKKREATPEGKSEADAWLYYNTYGVWPSWWAGYGGYGLGLYDARSVKLLQKVNPMPTLGCITTHTVYGQHGTPDTIPMDLLFGDVRREKPKLSLKLMPKPKLTTS